MKMSCAQCGAEFAAGQADAACGGCAQRGGCGRVRCPYCGHEQVPAPVPSWFTRLRRRLFSSAAAGGGKHA